MWLSGLRRVGRGKRVGVERGEGSGWWGRYLGLFEWVFVVCFLVSFRFLFWF